MSAIAPQVTVDLADAPRRAPRPRELSRTERLVLAALRVKFAVLSAIAPRIADREALRFFFTPMRFAMPAWPPYAAGARETRVGEIATWSWGPDDRPLALLVHGWAGAATQLAAFVPALLATGFRVVAFDQPGHGRSGGGPEVTALDFRDATRRVIEAHGGRADAVIAHSLGAVGVTLAATEGVPVGRLVFLAPGREPVHFARKVAEILGLSSSRVDALIAGIAGRVGQSLETFDMAWVARTRREPLLVLHDTEDTEVPYDGSALVVSRWEGSRLEAVSGVGHFRILKNGAVTNRAVDFASRDLSRARSTS